MNILYEGIKLPDFTELVVLLVVILLATLCWKFWKTAKRYADLPTSYNALFQIIWNFPIKNLTSLTSVMFQNLDAVCKQFEKEGMVHIWMFRHILFVFGEEAAKIFATDEASSDKSADYVLLKETLGNGLITSTGETWKNDRKLLNPVFHMEEMKARIPIFNKNGKNLVRKLANVADKSTIDILPFLEYAAFHNVGESFLGENLTKREDIDIGKGYKILKWIQIYMSTRWILPPTIATLHKFCTPSGWKSRKLYQEGCQYIDEIISPAVESISRKLCDSENDIDLNRKTLLEILLDQQLKNPCFTQRDFRDHLFTFLAAGSDTVIYTLMWCLYLLGLYKDVQNKAYEEVQSVSDEEVTYENLFQLEYLECILKETLRLYPTVPIFARHLKKDVQCGKYTVPKDTTIMFFLYRLHRNPEIYPDPEEFIPDRFRSTNIEQRKWAHLPFSEGYRSCIGKKFAMMEMKVTLAYIIRNYEITSFDKRKDVDLRWNFLLMPKNPLRMSIAPRQILPEGLSVSK